MTMTKAEQRKLDNALTNLDNARTNADHWKAMAEEHYRLIEQFKEHNADLNERIRKLQVVLEAEEKNHGQARLALSQTAGKLNKCLGWISAKQDKHPLDNDALAVEEEPVEHFGYMRDANGRRPL